MRFAVLMLCVAMLVVPQAYAADEALISQQHCQQLTAHTPQDNVRYRGGVDVNGKAIAPADLADEDEASSNWADDLAKQATVAVTVDLASYLGLAMPQPGLKGEVPLGVLELGPGGDVLFNGQSLSDLQKSRLTTLCRGR
jgi:hypothetical protein